MCVHVPIFKGQRGLVPRFFCAWEFQGDSPELPQLMRWRDASDVKAKRDARRRGANPIPISPMANDLSAVIPQVLSQAVLLLRQNAIMPRLINTDYSNEVAEQGDTIDIPIPSAIQTRDVVPGPNNVAPNNEVKPKKTQLVLNNWKEAPFTMNDKEITSVMRGVAPRQLQEAVKAIANDVDGSILNCYKDVYGVAGTAGSIPFATSTVEAQEAFRTLNIQLCPREDRRIVLDPFAEANAIGLPQFQNVDKSGSDETIRNAVIGRKLGFDWYQDQNITRHVAGTASGFVINQANHAVGDEQVTIAGGTGTFAVGDVFSVAGDTDQTYVVKSVVGTTLSYAPKAKAAWANNAAITKKASHTVNLAFHRDAFGFASRQMTDVFAGGSEIMSMADPVSGIVLRLEVSRQHKQTQWSLDCLWGAKAVMPDLACRILGQ